MGVIKAFFRPLTKFIHFYKSMTQGYVENRFQLLGVFAFAFLRFNALTPHSDRTPEEIARRAEIESAGALYQQKFKETEALLGNVQADMVKQVTSRMSAFQQAKKKFAEHENLVMQLGNDLRDPDSDKERIFAEMQRLGIQMDHSGLRLSRTDELLTNLRNISHSEAVVDLKPIAAAIEGLAIHQSATQEKMREITDSITYNHHVKPDEVLEAASKEALAKGVDPTAIQHVKEQVKQSAPKKQL